MSFVSEKGDLHWVIYDDLAGSYQYFVNRALGDISILRSLFRLDPDRFPNGRTYLKDEPLPSLQSILDGTKVQDETFETSDGTYITKYDWSNYVRDRDFNGVYGPSTGSWYIHPSTDYFSGNHLKQTLTVSASSNLSRVLSLPCTIFIVHCCDYCARAHKHVGVFVSSTDRNRFIAKVALEMQFNST